MAAKGDLAASEKLGRDAVDLSERSDFLILKGNIRMDLAEVLRMAGLLEAAEKAIGEALDLYEQKGATVLAEKARQTLRILTT